jgi:AraC-like DNA-binding protein
MDALSDMLQAVRLTGGVFLDARFTAPWCVSSRIDSGDCRPWLVEPVQVIAYHHVVEGRMLVSLEGERSLEVRAGETVLLPRNEPHVLSSAAGLPPVDPRDFVQPADDGGLMRIVHGGGGEPAHIVCGFLGSDQDRNPLLETLPRILKVDMAKAGSSDWIESSLRFALRGLGEGKVGSSMVMSRLSELMFVEAVRAWIATQPPEQLGWIAGVRDPFVGQALALLHSRPNHRWTAESLAQAVALSRSAFSDRFTALVGMPPIRYLTAWRLQVACDRLREGRQSIAQIAYDIGYEAEVAFIRAFKREFGVPPATWRKQAQNAGDAA